MIKHILTIAVAVTSLSAQAQTVEFIGCFVQENNQCADVDITCGSNPDDNYAAFDLAVGRLCDQILTKEKEISELIDSSTLAEASSQDAKAEAATYKRLYSSLLTKHLSARQRVNRLRKACGKKCRGL